MVTIRRMSTTTGINYIKDWLVMGEDFQNEEALAENLKAMMVQYKERAFFLLAAKPSGEQDEIVGFLLAFIHPSNMYVVLYQVYGDNGVVDKMFLRMLLWCDQMEVTEVRTDDIRGGIEKLGRWGFEQKSVTYTTSVVRQLDEKVLSPKKEVDNAPVVLRPTSPEPGEPNVDTEPELQPGTDRVT